MRGQMIYRNSLYFFLLQRLKQGKLEFKKRIITDPVLIKKYDEELNYHFYTPQAEDTWFDTELIMQHRYTKSKKFLSHELQPIYVAVNDEDDNIDDPLLRIHGKVIDGRQRYADSKVLKQRWSVVYVFVKDYEDYIHLWSSMGSKKSPEIVAEQTGAIIRSYCNLVWKQKPRKIFDRDGIPKKENVSRYVCNKLDLYWSKTTIRKNILPEFKIPFKNTSVARKEVEAKKLSKKDKRIIQLDNQVQELLKRNDDLKLLSKSRDEKDKTIHSLGKKIEKLNGMITLIKSDMKKYRKEYGIDKTDKDFEAYWTRYETSNELYV